MPDIPQGKLTTLQESVAALLKANSVIAASGLSVITSKQGSIQSQIDEAMAGMKATIAVYPPDAFGQNPNLPCVTFKRVPVTLRVTVWPENFNSTAADVAEYALRVLHHAAATVAESETVTLLSEDQGPTILAIDHPSYDMVDVFLYATEFGLETLPSS